METLSKRLNFRFLIAGFALVAMVLAATVATRAEAAKVANPGSFTASIPGGTFRIKTNTFDLSTIDPDPTLVGTVTSAGVVTFPKANITFPPLTFDYDGSPITVRLQPTHDWTGSLNPLNGAGSIRARFKIKIEGSASGVSLGGSCFIGSDSDPVDVNTAITGTTSPPGPNTPISGSPYNVTNGELSLVNNSLAITQTASGCATFGLGNGPINDALGLPSAAGNNEVRLNTKFNPIVQKGVNASYTVTPASGPAPLNVAFNGSGSTIAAGVKTCTPALPTTPNCGYRWDFDGNGTVDQVTNTASTSNTYLTAGTYTSRLTIFDNDGDSDTTTRTVTVGNRPDLTIDKSHAGNFRSGQQGTYSLTVTNGSGAVGPTTGTTTVTDTLPAGLTYVSATGSGWTCANVAQLVTCTRTAAIAAGASAPPITLTVNVGDGARPSVTNTAEVSTPTEAVTANNSDSDLTLVDAVDVSIAKSHTGSFRVGRNEPYSLRVRNDGTLATTGTTTVSDSLPTGMNYFSSSAPAGWTCNGSGATFSCSHPDPLPVGYDETITLTVAVDGTALPARVNTATISTPGDTDSSDDSSSDPTVVVAAPDLSIDKSHDADFRVGGTGTYDLLVKNDGALPTVGTTTVTDSVPAGLPVVSASGSGWICDVQGQDVTCTSNAVLQPDEAAPEINVVTDVNAAAQPSVTNTATVATSGTGPAADPNPANDSDSDPTTVTAVDLTIDKSHVGSGFPVGGSGSYTLAVRNAGTAATVGTTTVTDTLPADLSFVSASGSGWSCGAVGQDVTCTRNAVIGAGASPPSITLNVTVANTTADDVTNTATVSTTDDVNNANDSDTDVVNLTAADLQIVKSHTGDFRVGTNRTYELRVRNVGPLPTIGSSTVTDVLPAGLTYVSATGPGWSCNNAGQTVTCTRTSAIAGGGPASTIQLVVAVGAGAVPSVTNTATVANGGDRNPANDSSSDPTTVTAPDLAISKSHQGQLRAGGTATYDIDVDNDGTAATSAAATVTDILPTGLTYTGFTGDDWDCSASGQTVTCEHPAAIAAGGSASSLELRVSVAANAGNQITNTATVATAADSNVANNSDDDVSGVGRIDLDIDKTHSGDLPRGGLATYTLDVTNDGDIATDGPIRVSDTLPSGLRYSSAGGSGWNCDFASGTVNCIRDAALAGNESASSISIEVGVADDAPGSITNTATVSTRDDGNAANDSASDPATVTSVIPDVALSLKSNGPLQGGSAGSYALSVRNVGSGPTTGTTSVALTLLGTTFKSGSGNGWVCNGSGAAATCTHSGPIAVDERSDLTVEVDVDPSGGLVIASATATTPGDPNTGNDSASELGGFGPKIDVAAGISHSGAFSVGKEGTFAVSATNNGGQPTSGTTTVRVPLPGSLDYVSASGSGWSCGPTAAGVLCEHPGTIAGGQATGFELKVKPSSTGSAAVTATSATPDDADASNDAATDSVDVGGGTAALQLKKAKIKVPKSGAVAVPVTCPSGGDCSGTLVLSLKGKSVGEAKYSVGAGQSSTVTVKLAKTAKKALAKKGKLKVVATAGSSTAKLKLTQPKKKS